MSNPFTDLETHWSQNYVMDLYKRRLIDGYKNNIFKPDQPITRAELTKLALVSFGWRDQILLASDDQPFKDINADDWFSDYVITAKDAGIINGYKDDTFKPNQSINRAETIKILMNAAGYSDNELEAKNHIFADVKADDWYSSYLNYAYSQDVISGYTDVDGNKNFQPMKAITRAEAVKMISKILENSKF